MGFNETGQDVAEFFREKKREVICVDLDPCLHASLKFAYKGVRGHRVPRCRPIEELKADKSALLAAIKANSTTRANDASAAAGGGGGASEVAPFEMPESPQKEAEPQAPTPQILPAPVEPDVSLPGAPSDEVGAGVAVAGEGFGVAHIEQEVCRVGAVQMRREQYEIALAASDSAHSNVMGVGFGNSEEELEAELDEDAQQYEDAATKTGGFTIEGFLFGSGTNIFSILADPELESTWERVNLKEADLVVACLVQRDSVHLCKYMEKHCSNVPVMAVCSNNKGTRKHPPNLLPCCCSLWRLCPLAALAACVL